MWTCERVEQLRKMVGEGLSYSHIASALGGLTRNAVIGKAHRLGLRSKNAPSVPSGTRIRKARASRAKPLRALVLDSLPEVTMPDWTPEWPSVSIVALELKHCRWPVAGEGRHMEYCGGEALVPLPYCAEHCRQGYRKPSR